MNPFNKSIQRVGDIRTYIKYGKTYTRLAHNCGKQPRSIMQMQSWCSMTNIVRFYSKVRDVVHHTMQCRKAGQSAYNRFVQLNKKVSPVWLTKQEADDHACIAAPYFISDGTLPNIALEEATVTPTGEKPAGRMLLTSLQVGDFSLDTDSSMAILSTYLMANNKEMQLDDELWLVCAMQTTDVLDNPNVEVARWSLRLTSSSIPIGQPDAPELLVVDGRLAFIVPDGEMVAGIIHYRPSSGQASRQQLISCMAETLDRHTADEAFKRASESYGVAETPMLMPEAIEQRYESLKFISKKNYSNG